METNGSVNPDEAAAALAAVRRARARVAWGGYPAWYWLATGAGLGALAYAVLLPHWWVLAIAVGIAAGLVVVDRAASQVRGVREGCHRSTLTARDRVIRGGPAALVLLGGAAASKFASWPPAATAVLVFAVFAGTGIMMSARAARP